MEPFISPYQYNYIKGQLKYLLRSVYFTGDNRVVEATQQGAHHNVLQLFPALTPEQRELLAEVPTIQGQDELNRLLGKLRGYVIPFPDLGAEQIKKLFPKVKKLIMPEWDKIEHRDLTYLGWRDIAQNSLYMIYPLNGELHALECKYVSGSQNRVYKCCLCNRALKGIEMGLVTTVSKKRKDIYKSYGNYMCLNSDSCNRELTNVEELEIFVSGKRV